MTPNALILVDCSVQGGVFAGRRALSHVRSPGHPCELQRLGRSERRPVEGGLLWGQCLTQRWCQKGGSCRVTSPAGSCWIQGHPALPLIRRLRQRLVLSGQNHAGGHRQWLVLEHKGLVHRAEGAPGRCFPWAEGFVDFFLEGRLSGKAG